MKHKRLSTNGLIQSDSGTTNPISKYGSSNESKYYKINYDDTSELDFTIRSSTNFGYFNGSIMNVYKWDNVKLGVCLVGFI